MTTPKSFEEDMVNAVESFDAGAIGTGEFMHDLATAHAQDTKRQILQELKALVPKQHSEKYMLTSWKCNNGHSGGGYSNDWADGSKAETLKEDIKEKPYCSQCGAKREVVIEEDIREWTESIDPMTITDRITQLEAELKEME